MLAVMPAHAGKLFALASVEVDIDGVQIMIHGIRALHVADPVAEVDMVRTAPAYTATTPSH